MEPPIDIGSIEPELDEAVVQAKLKLLEEKIKSTTMTKNKTTFGIDFDRENEENE